MIQIYIDADGCPVKDETYRVAERYKLHVFIVANKWLAFPQNSLFEMIVVPGNFDAADDWIAEHVDHQSIVVTADILLAERCLKKQARVLGSKGEEFTHDNIGMAVSTRELAQNVRLMGEKLRGSSPMDKKARSLYLGKLDQIIQSLKRSS